MSRPEVSSARRSWQQSDLTKLMVLSVGSLVANVTPSALDQLAAECMVRVHRRVRTRESLRIAERMASLLPPGTDGRMLAEAHARMRLEDFWGRLRGIGFRSWHPAIELEGEGRLRDALARGRGAVLWSIRLSSATAIKQALSRAGLPLVHLSRTTHGADSDTLLAERVVSPFYCRAENPYLRDRVKIPVAAKGAYFETLRQWLRQNACVSIFGEHLGRRRNITVPFLGGVRAFASGAPSLAWLEDAALFTAYAVRTGPFAYRVVIDEAIPVDRTLSQDAFAAQAVGEFARRLESLIKLHPSDWQGWSFWKTAAPLPAQNVP